MSSINTLNQCRQTFPNRQSHAHGSSLHLLGKDSANTLRKLLSHHEQPQGVVAQAMATLPQLHPSSPFPSTAPAQNPEGLWGLQPLGAAPIASEVFEQELTTPLPRRPSRTNKVFVGGGVKNSSK